MKIGNKNIDKLAVCRHVFQLDSRNAVKVRMVIAIPAGSNHRSDRVFYRSRPHLKILRGIGIGALGDPVMLIRLLQDVVHDVNDIIKPNKPTGSADAPKQFCEPPGSQKRALPVRFCEREEPFTFLYCLSYAP